MRGRRCYPPRLGECAHVLIYTPNPAADRACFRDVLGSSASTSDRPADLCPAAGGSGLPSAGPDCVQHSRVTGHAMLGAPVYLMCDACVPMISALGQQGARCTPLADRRKPCA